MPSDQSSGDTDRGFTLRGMEPQRNIYDFQISVDAEFADRLRDLEVPDKQEGAADHIKGALTHDMADVRFLGESFLLSGITVGFQATGLDLHKEERGRQTFATHNVDSSTEAIEVVAAFSRWEELANHVLEDQQKDDGLRADGGSERVECADCGDEVLEEGAWSLRDREGFYCPDCAHKHRDVDTGTDHDG